MRDAASVFLYFGYALTLLASLDLARRPGTSSTTNVAALSMGAYARGQAYRVES
jgi:hypothetical protein